MNLLLVLAITTGIFTPSKAIAEVPPEPVEKVLSIEEKIVLEATNARYSPERAVAIARAESGLNPNAKNKTSSASGIFQFINGTFNGFCIDKYHFAESMDQKNDPDIQIKCAVKMLAEGGESHWYESRKHWE